MFYTEIVTLKVDLHTLPRFAMLSKLSAENYTNLVCNNTYARRILLPIQYYI